MNNVRKIFAALLSAVMLISANSQLLSVTADAATTERSMIQFDLAYFFPSDKQIKLNNFKQYAIAAGYSTGEGTLFTENGKIILLQTL